MTTTLTAWKFETPEGAEAALAKIELMQEQRLIEVADAATVSWEPGKKRPKTKQAFHLAAAGAFDGAFWGMLFGILFFVPILGMVVGASLGALTGSLADVGIDDDFIDSIRAKVTPGTSALFLLTDSAVIDRVAEGFEGDSPELISSNLTSDQEAVLSELFAS